MQELCNSVIVIFLVLVAPIGSGGWPWACGRVGVCLVHYYF
jgi:hypothetical protein